MSYLHSTTTEDQRVALCKSYVLARWEAHTARLTGNIALAETHEGHANAIMHEAASEDHDCTTWETLIEKCDALADQPCEAGKLGHPHELWARLIPKTRAERRAAQLDTLDRRFGIPSASSLRVLSDKGFKRLGWGEWILDQADNCGISPRTAANLFDTLGESEAFDGFVTSCEDQAEQGEDL
jgi:hypothetical protein